MILYYLLVSAMPLVRHPLWAEFVGELTVIKYVGLGCVAYMGIYASQRRTAPRFFDTWQARWFWILVSLSTFSYCVMGSSDPIGLSPLMIYISFAMFFFITLIVVDSVDRLRNVLLVSIGSMAFASLYVVREWQKGGFAAGNRPGWVTGDPNYFTVSALLFLPMALYLRPVIRSSAVRAFCMACFGITLVAVFAAASRGGFMGLVTTAVYFGLRSRRRATVISLGCIALLTLALIVPTSPLNRLMDPDGSDTESSDHRLRLWTLGINAATHHPLTGVGPGNFKTLTAGAEDFHVAHNTYVELAAELGFPGVLLFLAVLGATFHSAERVRRTAAAAGAAIFVQVAHGVEAGLLGYVVSAFFVSVAWQKFLWLLIFLSISLHQIATAQLRQPTVSQKPAANRPAGV